RRPWLGRVSSEPHSTPQRIAGWPILVSGALIDDGHQRLAVFIVVGKRAAAQERGLYDLEVIGAYLNSLSTQILQGLDRSILNGEALVRRATDRIGVGIGARQSRGDCGEFRSRNRLQAPQQLTIKGGSARHIEIRVRIAFVGIRQLYVCRDDVSGVEAWIFVQQTPQRPQQQTRSDHQDDGKGQLRNDENIPQSAGLRAVTGPSTAFTDGRGESDSCRMKRWNKSEDQAGENGNQQSERQHHPV